MAAVNLQTTSRGRLNSPRDLEDTSEVSSISELLVVDQAAGATFVNTGNQVILFTGPGGADATETFRIARNGVSSEYVGVDVGDDSAHAYDVVVVPTNQTDPFVIAVGPFDPNRYNDANGLVTITSTADAASDNLALLGILDISSRRTARSTATR